MINKLLLAACLLTNIFDLNSVIQIFNATPWPETVYLDNKDSKQIGWVKLQPNDLLILPKATLPQLKHVTIVRRHLSLWQIPQDCNPGETAPIKEVRSEELTKTDQITKILALGAIKQTIASKASIKGLHGYLILEKIDLAYTHKIPTPVKPARYLDPHKVIMIC